MNFTRSLLTLITFGVAISPQAISSWGINWDLLPQEIIPIAIFLLRTVDLTLSTLRLLLIVRGKAFFTWFVGFLEALSFILGITGVISNLQNPLNLVAYAVGFATGNVIGMTIESRVAPGHSLLRIISAQRGNLIAEKLRGLGRGVTDLPAKGKQGMVSLLLCYVPRREVNRVKHQILAVDPEVFITVEEVRELRGGWQA